MSAPQPNHHNHDSSASTDGQPRLCEVISALSYALDLSEGQPEGHAIRSCIIGMRIADELKLSDERKSDLFYSLLLKDIGGSSSASQLCDLYQADDLVLNRDIKCVDSSNLVAMAKFAMKHAMPRAFIVKRIRRVIEIAKSSDTSTRSLAKMRCEYGANLVQQMGFSESTARAILEINEHFDGGGHPIGRRLDQISLEAQICSLAQTMDAFISAAGFDAARDIARERANTWFNPEVVKAFLGAAKYASFKKTIADPDPRSLIEDLEPADLVRTADPATLDRIALGFSRAIDAKSPWTRDRSKRVAKIALGIAQVMGMPNQDARELRRAALLFNVGMLGVSNLILDKDAGLTEAEFDSMKQHVQRTKIILDRSEAFRSCSGIAAAHHERLDGSGYPLELTGDAISLPARILAVADVCEALAAKRPYRSATSAQAIIEHLQAGSGTEFCPEVVAAFITLQEKTEVLAKIKPAVSPAPTPDIAAVDTPTAFS